MSLKTLAENVAAEVEKIAKETGREIAEVWDELTGHVEAEKAKSLNPEQSNAGSTDTGASAEQNTAGEAQAAGQTDQKADTAGDQPEAQKTSA